MRYLGGKLFAWKSTFRARRRGSNLRGINGTATARHLGDSYPATSRNRGKDGCSSFGPWRTVGWQHFRPCSDKSPHHL
ncbi:hypothetical protein PSPO01_14078 [Paraphaeosphaeria sporulosa]